MSDRVGHRRVILLSMLVPVPFLVAAPNVPPQWTLACLAIAGFFMLSTLPVNVSFGQLIAPVSAATVASLLMGFAWGVGALLVPVTGWIADHWGLDATMTALGSCRCSAWRWPGRCRGAWTDGCRFAVVGFRSLVVGRRRLSRCVSELQTRTPEVAGRRRGLDETP